MSEEQKNAGEAGVGTAAASVPTEQPFLDEHTTEPNTPAPSPPPTPSPDGKWQMPKPKFQQTSGYLPQGYLKEMDRAAAEVKASPGSEDISREQEPIGPLGGSPAAVPLPAIEPQPDLADQLIPEEPSIEPPKAAYKPSSAPTALMFILGLIGIGFFVALFIAAVWYFYFTGRQIGPFN